MKIVRNIKTGVELKATPRLLRMAAERNDLEVIEVKGKGKRRTEKKVAPSPKIEGNPDPNAEDGDDTETGDEDTGDDGEGEPETGEPDPSEAEATIEGITGKDALEEFMRENYGYELDKRKKLETLKAESLKVIADAEAEG